MTCTEQTSCPDLICESGSQIFFFHAKSTPHEEFEVVEQDRWQTFNPAHPFFHFFQSLSLTGQSHEARLQDRLVKEETPVSGLSDQISLVEQKGSPCS